MKAFVGLLARLEDGTQTPFDRTAERAVQRAREDENGLLGDRLEHFSIDFDEQTAIVGM